MDINNSITVLLNHANSDTGGSKRCAMFLLSLWDGGVFKADLQEILYSDAEIFVPMISVLEYLYGSNSQLDDFVSEDKMKPIADTWGKIFRQGLDKTK